MKAALRQASILLLIAGVLASAFWLWGDSVPLWDPEDSGAISLSAAESFSEVLWLDVRTAQEYQANHIEGAVWMDMNSPAWLEPVLQNWDGVSSIVVYCGGGDCANSRAVRDQLKKDLGWSEVYYLTGGYPQ